MIDLFISKLRFRDEVSDVEAAALFESVARTKAFEADANVIYAGQELSESLLLLDGFAYRYKDLLDGDRQILELNVPGDFVDLHGFLLKEIDHGVVTATRCTFAYVPHTRLKRITEELPHLARLLWLQTVLDAAIHREWVTTLGQRSAIGRLAQLFCELYVRLSIVKLADEDDHSFGLPLTQTELAEATGLTSVHVNRTLKVLRDEGLVTVRSGRVVIHDMDGLKRRAQFDPTYLALKKRAR